MIRKKSLWLMATLGIGIAAIWRTLLALNASAMPLPASPPQIAFSPTAGISVTLEQGMTTTVPITITNVGGGLLDWQIDSNSVPFQMPTAYITTPNDNQPIEIGEAFLQKYRIELGLTESDLAEMVFRDSYVSQKSGITHLYFSQQLAGIPVYKGDININIDREGRIINLHNDFVPALSRQANRFAPLLSGSQALQAALKHLGISNKLPAVAQLQGDSRQKTLFAAEGVSLEEIPVQLTYFPMPDGAVRLAWEIVIHPLDAQHWWHVLIDAENGEALSQVDWVIHDLWVKDENLERHSHIHPSYASNAAANQIISPTYRVFAEPMISPLDGSRSLEIDPSDAGASPYGWHDTDGGAGAEYTITRGNNVHAYEDSGAANAPGFNPDGGAGLNFDFPLDLTQVPSTYYDASLTNLFYWNNVMHDVWYQYGFDEAAGNFQENNYGNGGVANDYVLAEGQDGAYTNNASFSVAPDGIKGRMQMFLWSPAPVEMVTINSPSEIAGSYLAASATFGPLPPDAPSGITGNVVLAQDNSTTPTTACQPLVNGSEIAGNIALIDRGACSFVLKVQHAQDAGAIGVIIANHKPHGVTPMSGVSPSSTIPAVMISKANGDSVKVHIDPPTSGASGVTATLTNPGIGPNLDGDLDNGIIAHEYGHGISIRLAGGAATSNCLSNAEQGGEGWSDWFALMMTIKAGEDGSEGRGMGTYALGQSADGYGIREYPYSTDMALDPRTYDHLINGSPTIPHGVGSVWAGMLWEMSWALIDAYGFDPDLYNGAGGNNLAMQLVIDGLKLQPCDAGFVEARDAILQADLNYSRGVNQCLIWKAFAKRGLGFSADQGDPDDIMDGTEAFDVPAMCNAPPIVCQNPDALPWLSFDPGSGEDLPGGSSDRIDVLFDPGMMAAGIYSSSICIQSNDPIYSPIVIPITMTIPSGDIYLPFVSKSQP